MIRLAFDFAVDLESSMVCLKFFLFGCFSYFSIEVLFLLLVGLPYLKALFFLLVGVPFIETLFWLLVGLPFLLLVSSLD